MASAVDLQVQPLHEELQELLGVLLAGAREGGWPHALAGTTRPDGGPCSRDAARQGSDHAARAPAWPPSTAREASKALRLPHLYPEKEGTYFWKTARNRVGFTASQESGCHRAPITSAKAIGVGVGKGNEG